MSTNWKDTSYDLMRLVVNRLVVQIGFCDGFVCWKDISHNSGGIAYVYRLTSHDLRGNGLRFDPSHRWLTRSASADSIVQSSVSTSKSWSPGTTFELDCGYHLRVSSTSYVWQIPFRRTFEVTCMDLAITNVQCASTLRPIEVGMVNLSPPDLVRFCAQI